MRFPECDHLNHPRESGDPILLNNNNLWIPAFAGMMIKFLPDLISNSVQDDVITTFVPAFPDC